MALSYFTVISLFNLLPAANSGKNKITRNTFHASKDIDLNDKEADATSKMEDPVMYRSNLDMLVSKSNMTTEVSQLHCKNRMVYYKLFNSHKVCYA